MPLTLPALFVYIEVKDYIPAAFAGARLFMLCFCSLLHVQLISRGHNFDLVRTHTFAYISDFTDALFNPTKGSEKTAKTPKEVRKGYESKPNCEPSFKETDASALSPVLP